MHLDCFRLKIHENVFQVHPGHWKLSASFSLNDPKSFIPNSCWDIIEKFSLYWQYETIYSNYFLTLCDEVGVPIFQGADFIYRRLRSSKHCVAHLFIYLFIDFGRFSGDLRYLNFSVLFYDNYFCTFRLEETRPSETAFYLFCTKKQTKEKSHVEQ